MGVAGGGLGSEREVGAIYRSVVLTCCLLMALVTFLGTHSVARKRVMWGKAVYYSNRYKGETMACGGRYRPRKMIAAHRSLPCGTELRVKNRANGRVVTVTVRDRGPYGHRRLILDLSRRAARKLRYRRAGKARVKAVILPR
ncbi:MAG TPA: septal ring lytic transglycosylase RlpA family protein [Actinomycetota bacterium]|nr:septal ring lytic transglycosylase RlpA family protein [Actinomycetota bacterium]